MPDTAFHLFRPILAGATLRSRVIGCVGALLAIGLTGLIPALVVGGVHDLPLIVAPMGASAVLLFAVPTSPLAQPWPVIGGNTIATLVGIATARLVADPYLAAGIAVSLAILIMSLTRSLHPPGGAAALTAVIGGKAVASAGFVFALVPVALNSVLMVAIAILFHRLTRTIYPHRPTPAPANTHGTSDPSPVARVGFTAADVDAALASLHEAFDIDRDDLTQLLQRIELNALSRSLGGPTCADIMSRDVITIPVDAPIDAAVASLLEHNIRTLPVLNAEGQLTGTVGLRELIGKPAGTVGDYLTPATVVALHQPAIALLPTLTDGRHHMVMVHGEDGALAGVVSQTDLLAALYRMPRRVSA